MKVVFSVSGKGLEQLVSPVFGRCRGFEVLEIEGSKVKESSFLPNPAFSAGMGAGIAAAQAVAEAGAEAVVTGNVGPNAFMVLNQAGIKVFRASGISVEDAAKRIGEGSLPEMAGSNVPGHFGMGPGFGRGGGFGRGRRRGPPTG
jgi:predicted Fe-Mo cluster-binding NifX family protein